MHTRVLAPLLVLMALVPAGSPLWLLCQDGSLHHTCCCQGEATQPTDEARIEAADCCVVSELPAAQPSPTVGSDAFQLASPLLIERPEVAPVALLVEAPAVRVSVTRARGPPPQGPPLYVENCSFLI